jgi:hypothetical protein
MITLLGNPAIHWKIFNSKTGKTSQPNNFQDLIQKFKNQNASDHVNGYFIYTGNNLTKSDNGKHGNSTVIEFSPVMQQEILKNYPKIRNEPTTPKETGKIIKAFKTKRLLWLRSITLSKI